MEKEFVRVRSAYDYIISFALLVIGGVIVAIPTSVSINIVGIFSILAGILLLVILKSAWKDTSSGIIFRKKEMYFPQSCRDRIVKAISGNIDEIDVSDEDKGNGLRVDIFYNRKEDKAFILASEYIPYRYEPASAFYEFKVSHLHRLLK